MRYSDEMWEELWERTLGQVERHRIAMATLRREFPDDPLGRRIVPELAYRWRGTARLHLWLHALHAVFWGRISFDIPSTAVTEWRLANTMTLISVLVVLGCMSFRRYLEPIARLR